jgi:hypothetical protein
MEGILKGARLLEAEAAELSKLTGSSRPETWKSEV